MSVERLKKVAILPAGQWGSALALPISEKVNGIDCEVMLYFGQKEGIPDRAEEFNRTRRHEKLRGVEFGSSFRATNKLDEAASDCDVAVIACSAQALRFFYQRAMSYFKEDTLVLHVIKGLEIGTNLRMSEVILEEDPGREGKIAVLSGPNFAKEIAKRKPAATTIASGSIETGSLLQRIVNSSSFRVYTSTDVIGVELGGALKNVIAIAAGISDGMRMGDSGKASLVTRGLAEICRLGVALGAKATTFVGLSGWGDLMLTCTSPQSRNYKFGRAIGRGSNPQELLALDETVEGVRTVEPAVELARQMRIEVPVMQNIFEIIHEGKKPRDVYRQLMDRKLTMEHFVLAR